jgi:hypothetical protein
MPTHVPLSASRIKKAKAIGHDLWLSDDDGTRAAGRLVLRVTPTGSKRFYFRPPRSKNSSASPVPLGVYSRTKKPNRLTLAEARYTAAILSASITIHKLSPTELARLALGGSREPASGEPPGPLLPHDVPAMAPAAALSAGAAALEPVQEPSKRPTLADVCGDYVQALKNASKVSARDVENDFKRFIYGTEIGSRPAVEVTTDDFVVLLRTLIGPRRTQQKLRSYLHSAYAKAINAKTDMTRAAPKGESGISVNPITSIGPGKTGNARTRNLTIPEFRALWARMQLTPDNSGSLPLRTARLTLLLGGQRCEQLLRVLRTQLDIEARTILLLDSKGRRDTPRLHLLPLPPKARAELTWLNNHSASVGSPFVFAGAGPSKHMSSGEVSKLVTSLCREMLAAGECISQFQFSDFRRTAETQLAALDVPSDIRKRIQSHDLGGVQAKHYDMYEYFKQKTKALILWERFLDSLLDGTDPPRWGEDLRQRKKAKSPARTYELAHEAKKTGASKPAVKEAAKKAGPTRKAIEKALKKN